MIFLFELWPVHFPAYTSHSYFSYLLSSPFFNSTYVSLCKMEDEPNTRASASTRSGTIDKSHQNDDIMQLFASDDEESGTDLPESDPSLANKIINQCDYQTFDNESQPGPSTTRSISLKSKSPTREFKTGKEPVNKHKKTRIGVIKLILF